MYLLAVFFPQSSTWRLLLPLAPALGAFAVPRSVPLRVGLVVLGIVGQLLWVYGCWVQCRATGVRRRPLRGFRPCRGMRDNGTATIERGHLMAAMKPRTGDGPMEAVKEGRLIIVRVPLEGGGRLVVSVNDDEAKELHDALAGVIAG